MDYPDISNFPPYLFINVCDVASEIEDVKIKIGCEYLEQLLLEIVQCATMSSGYMDNLEQLCENYSVSMNDEPKENCMAVCSLIIHLGDHLIQTFKNMKAYSEDDVCYYRLEDIRGSTLMFLKKVNPDDHYCNMY